MSTPFSRPSPKTFALSAALCGKLYREMGLCADSLNALATLVLASADYPDNGLPSALQLVKDRLVQMSVMVDPAVLENGVQEAVMLGNMTAEDYRYEQ